jgi:8-oxo-dGTP pyrophosphatase MutT (NUDIX family)
MTGIRTISSPYDLAASVLIVSGGKVLFAKHRKIGQWVPIGGHVEPGEPPEEAALREAFEECGLSLRLHGEREVGDSEHYRCLLRPAFMDLHRIKDDHWHLGIIYFATVTGGELRRCEREHEDLRWFSEEELRDPCWGISQALQYYASEALRYCRGMESNPPKAA